MELSAYRLLLVILTCYRLSRLIAIDDGPFLIFKRMRYYFLDKANYEMVANGIVPIGDNASKERWYGKWHTLAEGITCPYCVGVWLSVPLFVLYSYPTVLGDMFLILMAISGGQAFLQGLERK